VSEERDEESSLSSDNEAAVVASLLPQEEPTHPRTLLTFPFPLPPLLRPTQIPYISAPHLGTSDDHPAFSFTGEIKYFKKIENEVILQGFNRQK
jgi:hypothetical protein